MSTTTRYVYVHRWDCQHEEVVNGLGDRVLPDLVFHDDYTPIHEEAGYPCPACADPTAGHPYIAIKLPRPVAHHSGINNMRSTDITINNTAGDSRPVGLRPTATSFEPVYHNDLLPVRGNLAIGTQPPTNAPTGPRIRPHKPGHRCPEGVTHCHFHHSDPKACHKPVGSCQMALKAIRSSYYAAGRWTGAPMGWNEAHEACIRKEHPIRCAMHERFERDKAPTVRITEQ